MGRRFFKFLRLSRTDRRLMIRSLAALLTSRVSTNGRAWPRAQASCADSNSPDERKAHLHCHGDYDER
jgi:hypothetical protein